MRDASVLTSLDTTLTMYVAYLLTLFFFNRLKKLNIPTRDLCVTLYLKLSADRLARRRDQSFDLTGLSLTKSSPLMRS